MAAEKKHIVCLTHYAMGHVTPMLELANKLAQHHQVTFVCYDTIGSKLRKSNNGGPTIYTMPDDDSYYFALHKTSAENQEGLKKMLSGMDQFVQGLTKKGDPENASSGVPPVDAVIIDNMGGAATVTCMKRRIPFYTLNTGPAYNLSLFVHLLAEDIPTESPDQQGVPAFMAMPEADGKIHEPVSKTMLHEIFRPLKATMPHSKGVIINTIRELDSDTLSSIQLQPGMDKVPLYCVGPLISAPGPAKPENEKFKRWLDEKASGSVVYISFGSMMSPRPEQLKEIARAVQLLGRPVIWSVKKVMQEALPEDLKAEDFDKQILIVEWAPQVVILAHESVGVFVSHCGWNSTTEGLMSGKPFVAWPLCTDGLIIAELLVSKKVASHIREAGLRDPRLVTAEEIVNHVGVATHFAEEAKQFAKTLKKAVQKDGSSGKDFEALLSSF